MLTEREINAIGFTTGHDAEVLAELNVELGERLIGFSVATPLWYAAARHFHAHVATRILVTRSSAIASLQILASELVDNAEVHIPDLVRGLYLDISTERVTLGHTADGYLAFALGKAVFLKVEASEIIDRLLEKVPEADLATEFSVRTNVLRDWYTAAVTMPPASRMQAMQMLGYSIELIEAK